MRAGDTQGGISALDYAASNGHAVAEWKLGRIYAEGEGIPRDDLRAFQYFRDLADAHADDVPGTAQSRFVANAFVALGQYYLVGIPNSARSRVDPDRAREMFAYAATYFGDADAQFHIGRMYRRWYRRSERPASGGALAWLWLPTRGSIKRRHYSAQCCSRAM